jgi:hypothetical protein
MALSSVSIFILTCVPDSVSSSWRWLTIGRNWQVRNQIIGKRGTYVTLSLRRFMPSTGDLSHIFETRVQRELHPAPVSPGHSTREDQSAGPRQGPIIVPMHDNAALAEIRGTTQPIVADTSAVRMVSDMIPCSFCFPGPATGCRLVHPSPSDFFAGMPKFGQNRHGITLYFLCEPADNFEWNRHHRYSTCGNRPSSDGQGTGSGRSCRKVHACMKRVQLSLTHSNSFVNKLGIVV